MFDIDFTFFWTAVNLLILYLVVNRFLFKKLGAFMDDRSKSISAGIEEGEAAKREAEAFAAHQEEERADMQRERVKIIDDAKLKAGVEYDRIIQKAKSDSERFMNEARAEIERERADMAREVRREAAALAVAAASKIIKADMDSDKNRRLVDEFISDEGAA